MAKCVGCGGVGDNPIEVRVYPRDEGGYDVITAEPDRTMQASICDTCLREWGEDAVQQGLPHAN